MQPHGNNRWDGRDDVSFEDSERFEEDSQVSLEDSVEESQHNWRGWTDFQSNNEAIQPGLSCLVHQLHNTSGRFSSASTRTVVAGDQINPLAHHPMMSRGDNPSGILLTLSEYAAKVCAEKWSFQQLEEMYKHICLTRSLTMDKPPLIGPIPEKIFLSFIVHCFPRATDEIRMYSTLANGTADQYEFGKLLYQWGNVRDVSQTGFLLSGNVSDASPDAGLQLKDQETVHVTVKVDRCRIVECTCECSNRSSWCKHVVALCIYRISERSNIKFKETIADAINSMSDEELRKMVLWHINDIPRKCIPGFQKLIDQIKDKKSMINVLPGAPDPTDGGHEPISRYDFPEVQSKIRRLLIKYCVPAPAVHCDVAYLNSVQHPTHIEWTTMIKPFRSREPEGMWNLLQMIREMFARNDDNAVALLRTITDECISNSQVLLWWYISKLVQSGNWSQNTGGFKSPDTQYLAQLNCSELLDDIVDLWKLVAMNPRAGKEYRFQLAGYLEGYHRNAVTKLKGMINTAPPITSESVTSTDITALSNYQISVLLQTVTNIDIRYPLSSQNMKFTLNCFPGFHPAIQMCHYLNEQNIRFGVPEDAIFYVSEPNLSASYKMVPPHREKTLKKKKKRRISKKGFDDIDEFPIRPNEYRGVDGIWRVVNEAANENEEANDSAESGQESDVQKTYPPQEASKKKKTDLVENDVNEVLAASFTPLDALEARFLRIEAYGAHGFRADAIEHALKVIEYLMDSLTEQCHEMRKLEDDLPCTSKQSTSSASSCVSEEITGADREKEIARSYRFLSTLKKVLYITKVLKDSPHLQTTVFDISMRCLSLTKYPFSLKYHQILFTYLETEFVAILDQIWQNFEMGVTQMDKVRTRAKEIIENDIGNNRELPPIALTKFLFLALYWTEPGANRGAVQNANGGASAALQHNRSLLIPTDSDLALHVSLHIIGCRPLVSEKYTLHWETIRREKSELTSMLLVRYKDSHEKCALVIDKILDPKLHRMYQHHHSNAAYFLERCPEYLKRFKPGQRPIFPYPKEEQEEVVQEQADEEVKEDEDENAVSDYQAQIEAELARLKVEVPLMPPAPISRTRGSDERCSTSSETSNRDTGSWNSRSTDSADSDPNVPGPSNKIPIRNSPRKNLSGSGRRSKGRVDRSVSYDPGCTVNDAAVYHMTELSKKILLEAGGSHNNSIVWGGPNVVGTNRRLHLCSIAVSIYALGMSNRISPNWTSRTYNNIASWIASQTEEVGHNSLEMLRELWIAHFTPNEIAQISQRVAPVSDVTMRQESAKLALSVLPYAHALTDEEVIHALKRCKNESREMLVSALVAMDTRQFQEIGRSRPLFAAMTHWHELSFPEEERRQNQQQPNQQMHWQPQAQQWQPQEPPQAAPQQQPWHALIDQWQPEQAVPVQQQQAPPPPPPQPAPAGLVPNPFMIYFQNPAAQQQFAQPPPPPPQQPQLNVRHNDRNPHRRQAPPPPRNPPPAENPPPQIQNNNATPAQQVVPIPHGAWLYPQVYEADQPHLFLAPSSYRAEMNNVRKKQLRFHQSQSAPQLGNHNNDQALAMPVPDQQQHQPVAPLPQNALLNAWHYGMRALHCMGISPGEERHMYLKYSQNPPYMEDIASLHQHSKRLGLEYLAHFYRNAARSILSPYLLREYVKDSVSHFPHISAYNANARQQNAPQPLIPSHFIPLHSKVPGNMRYPGVRITTPGQITSHVVHIGFHHVTAELYERCCEQWLQAVINKMNSPRTSEQADPHWNTQLCDFVQNAYDTFTWVPNGRQYFEEFVRAIKRHRAFKKDASMATSALLQKLCVQ
ncbi:unnamed protein product [Caenorhabditis brenneri]